MGEPLSSQDPEVYEMIPAARRGRIAEMLRSRRTVRVSALSELKQSLEEMS